MMEADTTQEQEQHPQQQQQPEQGAQQEAKAAEHVASAREEELKALLTVREDMGTTIAVAAGAGDLEAVRYLIEQGGVDVNVRKKKGGNTPLHAALAQNHTELLDYLIAKGADVNARNARGQTALMLAVACSHGMEPVRKLLAAGADVSLKSWRCKQTALDLARAKGFTPAIFLLEKALEEQHPNLFDDNGKVRVDSSEPVPPGRRKCPICGDLIRTNPRVNFLIYNYETNILGKTQASTSASASTSDICTDAASPQSDGSAVVQHQHQHHHHHHQPEAVAAEKANPYISRFLQSKAFTALREDPKYHALADKHHLRKEVTETWAILEAVRAQCTSLNIDLESITLVDLCAGKSLTSALFGIEFPRCHVLAVDKLPATMVPHFDNNVTYLQADIMKPAFLDQLAAKVREVGGDAPAILVGMHLCGGLSLRAIDAFEAVPQFRGIVLSPCCFPSRRSRINVVRDSGLKDELEKYEFWTKHLHTTLDPFAAACQSFKDPLIYSNRNNIISATR